MLYHRRHCGAHKKRCLCLTRLFTEQHPRRAVDYFPTTPSPNLHLPTFRLLLIKQPFVISRLRQTSFQHTAPPPKPRFLYCIPVKNVCNKWRLCRLCFNEWDVPTVGTYNLARRPHRLWKPIKGPPPVIYFRTRCLRQQDVHFTAPRQRKRTTFFYLET